MSEPPVALTIAGSDSGGGAGIQADLKAMSWCGVHGCTVITALTAQNSVGVQGIFPVEPSFVRKQIDSVTSDFDVAATKTGMLFSRQIIEAVAEERDRLGTLVVDPVMVAESGDSLLEIEAERSLVEDLLPLADVITPNLPEAEKIGRRLSLDVDSFEELGIGIARSLSGPLVLMKGGHRSDEQDAVDVLYGSDGRRQTYQARRIETSNTHGSGCAYSSLITGYHAQGLSIPRAIDRAKKELTRGIREGYAPGNGAGTLNFLSSH